MEEISAARKKEVNSKTREDGKRTRFEAAFQSNGRSEKHVPVSLPTHRHVGCILLECPKICVTPEFTQEVAEHSIPGAEPVRPISLPHNTELFVAREEIYDRHVRDLRKLFDFLHGEQVKQM